MWNRTLGGLVMVALVVMVGCARNFDTDLKSLETSFADQRAAVSNQDGDAFVTAMERMVSDMKHAMKAVDAMPADQQAAAAVAFARVGDAGEKLYYSREFKSFLEARLQSERTGKRIQRIFEKMESMQLSAWVERKTNPSGQGAE